MQINFQHVLEIVVCQFKAKSNSSTYDFVRYWNELFANVTLL